MNDRRLAEWAPTLSADRVERARHETAGARVRGVFVRPAPAFTGRARERAVVDGILDRVRDGKSGALVIRGEAGIGKTTLLGYAARQASGCRLAQIAGVESELEMPFA